MERVRSVLVCALLTGLIALVAMLLWISWQLRSAPAKVIAILDSSSATMTQLSDAASFSTETSAQTLDLVGTADQRLKDMQTVLDSANVSVKSVGTLANKAGTAIQGIQANASVLTTSATTAINQTTNDLRDLHGVLQTIQESGEQLNRSILAFQPVVTEAATLLADDDIPVTVSNLRAMSSSGVTVSANLALMSTDMQKRLHLIAFPPGEPWYKRIPGQIINGGKFMYDFCIVTQKC